MNKASGKPYRGVLHGVFVKTSGGVMLVRCHCSFGDPEAINMLALLRSDFVRIFQAVVTGRLAEVSVDFASLATVSKVVVPEGYPDNPVKEEELIFCRSH